MKPKLLHTMIRIGNVERSIEFYTKILGYELVRKEDYPDGKFSLVFLKNTGIPGNEPELELTYNWGVESYDLGKGYGHMAYSVDSMEEFGEHIKKHGVNFSWGPSYSPSGASAMAFIKDPDGYSIEILQRLPNSDSTIR